LEKICKIEKLKILDISNNQRIRLDGIEEFNGIINIKNTLLSLTAANCNVSNIFLELILEFDALQYLCLRHNPKIGANRDEVDFENLKNTLIVLDLDSCNIGTNYLNGIAKLTKLQKLNINSSLVPKNPKPLKFDFSTLDTLIELNANRNDIKSDTFTSICLLENLSVLSIEECDIIGFKEPGFINRMLNLFYIPQNNTKYDFNKLKTSLRVLKAQTQSFLAILSILENLEVLKIFRKFIR
jgi:hypothetical protein